MIALLKRLFASLFSRFTKPAIALPEPKPEAPPPVIVPKPPAWVEGWYRDATRAPAHYRRVGSNIVPFAVVVHTTDMAPATSGALVRAWQNTPGRGNAAHFLIDRDGTVTQFASIFCNANHAGGPVHGWFRDANKNKLHPNRVSVGIEVHNAGSLVLQGKTWYHKDGDKLTKIPTNEVTKDPKRPGKGWHNPTTEQLEALDRLLFELEFVLAPAPAGLTIDPTGAVPAYATGLDPRICGHVSLDPKRKSDPGPQICEWLRSRSTRS